MEAKNKSLDENCPSYIRFKNIAAFVSTIDYALEPLVLEYTGYD